MKLLILDLDETLLHSTHHDEPRSHLPTFEVTGYLTQFRPHLREFLQHASAHYHLAIWTAAGRIYAQHALAALEEHTRLTLPYQFVFSRDRCTAQHPEHGHEGVDPAPLKDLKKAFRRGWRKEHTLILDDRPEGIRRHRGNHLPIHPWTGDPNDTELQRIAPILTALATVENVRTTPKSALPA